MFRRPPQVILNCKRRDSCPAEEQSEARQERHWRQVFGR